MLNIFGRKKDMDILKLLAETPICHELSRGEIKKLRKIVHVKNYKKDEIIFRKSDPGLGMHIILKGAVEISIKKDNKEVLVLAELGETNFFGDISLLDESLRSANAIAREDTTLIELYRPDFLDLLHTRPKTGIKMLHRLSKIIVQRLRRTNDELLELKKRVKD
ncbi:MAG: cyclic nucleotide-binding domain-containing protein [Candidatus Marinimicrobia bacterium]|nr:cyclic nucleotide-binding domain-containing protein [Candidatus Neomarinimicrobiota bacterium]